MLKIKTSIKQELKNCSYKSVQEKKLIIHEEKFIVFGGDRHHLPFNDFHYLNIEKEFELKNL